MTQSSANSLVLAMTQSGKSLMSSEIKRGPWTVSCGTPLTNGTFSETAQSTMTCWLLSDKKDSILLQV